MTRQDPFTGEEILTALDLHDHEGLSPRDIGERFGRTRSSIIGMMHRVAPTRDQTMAIIQEADRRGMHDFALGLSLQWWFGLRAVDVRGQWFEINEKDTGGITRETIVKRKSFTRIKHTRWQDGLTWDMFAPDLSGFTKVISKTASSNPEPEWFDLTKLPELQSRLPLLASTGRTGPVILSGDGLPYTREGWSNAFRRIRRHLKLPDDIRSMDLRAGAITEARDQGATLADMRDMATHASTDTTQRYIRGTEQARGRIIELRKSAK